ncbi:hypothetical protein BS78_01G392000 [Paspalum vaginatum]|nr:hypothetical protein BS78_01G392000 [Paspalum vaginatum]
MLSEVLGIEVGKDFESVRSLWLSNKRFLVHNIVCSAALWGVWKLRNVLCFQHGSWQNMGTLLLLIWKLAQNWILLCPEERRRAMRPFGSFEEEDCDRSDPTVKEVLLSSLVIRVCERVGGLVSGDIFCSALS